MGRNKKRNQQLKQQQNKTNQPPKNTAQKKDEELEIDDDLLDVNASVPNSPSLMHNNEDNDNVSNSVPTSPQIGDDDDDDDENGPSYTKSNKFKPSIEDELSKPYMAFGVIQTLNTARDIKIDKFSVALHGIELIKDTVLELNYGRRYGFIGFNGSGKSTMLKCIGDRLIPIPEKMDIFILDKEIEPTDKTPLMCVTDNVHSEVHRIEEELNRLLSEEGDEDTIQDLYKRLDELDPDTANARAGKILYGLGFNKEMQLEKKARDFSGGWRMRIALARALFVSPSVLLLDEPTNHLDLEATIWLEEYLRNYGRILVVISHSQDFLNVVCTNIIHLHQRQLVYYNGNFDSYVRAREEKGRTSNEKI